MKMCFIRARGKYLNAFAKHLAEIRSSQLRVNNNKNRPSTDEPRLGMCRNRW